MMQPTIYLLLIAFGALFILAIFHLTIYLQQNDKAFRNYAFYLFTMAGFNVIRLLDARLTNIYPLSYYTVGTLDPIFSNLGLLFYANFLGVVLNIKKEEKIYYNFWKSLQFFISGFVFLYFLLRITGDQWQLATTVITIASFCGLFFSLLMSIRLIRQRNEIFFQLIIAGTLVSLVGVLAGLAYNVFVVQESLAFGGMYFLEISILIEAIFLSAALGYRLKLAYQERTTYQHALLEETQKREVLALHTADLLKKQLDIQEVQNRISKDLHDDVGSSLSSLQIYSALAAKCVDTDPNQAKRMLEQITHNTSEIMENMGHIVWAMQPLEDQHQTIAFRIKNIGFNLLTIKNIACNYTFNDSIEALCKYPDLRKNIVLIFKEGINNIAKYSQALTAHISLTEEDGVLQINIEDDGIGFEISNSIGGNGLKNMQTRAKAMGGFTQITSSPGKGTIICCTIPLTTFSDIESN